MYYKCNVCGHECNTDDLIYVPESKKEFAYYRCPNCESREIYEDYDKEEEYYNLENIKKSLEVLVEDIDRDLRIDKFNYFNYENTLEKLLEEMGRYY